MHKNQKTKVFELKCIKIDIFKFLVYKRYYLFFDEVQRIDSWEEAINSFRVDFNCDIYITGSNAYLLSSEYSTYLSGRCVGKNVTTFF